MSNICGYVANIYCGHQLEQSFVTCNVLCIAGGYVVRCYHLNCGMHSMKLNNLAYLCGQLQYAELLTSYYSQVHILTCIQQNHNNRSVLL